MFLPIPFPSNIDIVGLRIGHVDTQVSEADQKIIEAAWTQAQFLAWLASHVEPNEPLLEEFFNTTENYEHVIPESLLSRLFIQTLTNLAVFRAVTTIAPNSRWFNSIQLVR